jgi:hypothetical protein
MDREDADMEHREPVREDQDFGSGDRRERSSRDRVSGTGMRIGVDCARVYPY